MSMTNKVPYHLAQRAIADLKTSIYLLLNESDGGMSNAQIGRSLGIYQGHVGHEGHIPRSLLELMAHEGVVTQDRVSKRWRLTNGLAETGE